MSIIWCIFYIHICSAMSIFHVCVHISSCNIIQYLFGCTCLRCKIAIIISLIVIRIIIILVVVVIVVIVVIVIVVVVVTIMMTIIMFMYLCPSVCTHTHTHTCFYLDTNTYQILLSVSPGCPTRKWAPWQFTKALIKLVFPLSEAPKTLAGRKRFLWRTSLFKDRKV